MHNPTQFKRKTSVAAVLFALSSTAVWAGDVNQAGVENATGAAASEQTAIQQPAASGADSAKEALGWRYVDGKDAGAGESAAAASDEGGKAAMSEEPGEALQAARPEESQGEPAAAAESSGEQDQAATSAESDSEDQAAKSEDAEDSGQSAMTEQEEGGSDRAVASDEEDGDRTAASEEGEGDQAAAAEEQQGGEERSAQSDGGQPNDSTAQSQVPAQLQGKVIVIIPKDWEGSMEGLLSVLQSSPDAKDIVIVQQGNPGDQGEPQAGSSQEPDDTYEASRTPPPANQQ